MISRRPLAVWLSLGVALAALGGAVAWMNQPESEHRSRRSDPPPADLPFVPSGPPWFRDMTARSGVDFTYRNGEEADQFTILESVGGGVALLDYDGDGLLDIFLPGGGYFDGPNKQQLKGHPCKLYKNLGGFRFKDVTKEAGLDGPWWYTHGAAVADYDRDGWPDLAVTGYGKLALFHNEAGPTGGRHFVDVSEKVGLKDDSWCTSAGWGDLDGDGYPDLYVCHYVDWSFANNPVCDGLSPSIKRDVCPPQRFKPLMHALFRNVGGQRFQNVSAEHGFKPDGCGLGVVLVDVNGDGRPDIYVANDATNKFLFLNRAGKKLEEAGMEAGVAVSDTGHFNGSMGVDAGDYDGSGRASLWVTNFQSEFHALYQNRGKERFNHQSRAAGIGALGQLFVGFGTAFVDVDNDGWEDLIIVNGHVLRRPILGSTLNQRPVLLRNVEYEGRRYFKDQSLQGGEFFSTPTVGRGLAVGDLDNDGWQDLVVSHVNTRAAVVRNIAGAGSASGARWLGIRLIGKQNRDVVGSAAVLEVGNRRLTRFAKGGGSYLSANSPILLFGLGKAERAGKLTVKWSWKEEQSWDGLELDHYYELHEGQAKAKRVVASPGGTGSKAIAEP